MRYDSDFNVFSTIFATKHGLETAIIADYLGAQLKYAKAEHVFTNGKPRVKARAEITQLDTKSDKSKRKVIGGLVTVFPFMKTHTIRKSLKILEEHYFEAEQSYASKGDQSIFYTLKNPKLIGANPEIWLKETYPDEYADLSGANNKSDDDEVVTTPTDPEFKQFVKTHDRSCENSKGFSKNAVSSISKVNTKDTTTTTDFDIPVFGQQTTQNQAETIELSTDETDPTVQPKGLFDQEVDFEPERPKQTGKYDPIPRNVVIDEDYQIHPRTIEAAKQLGATDQDIEIGVSEFINTKLDERVKNPHKTNLNFIKGVIDRRIENANKPTNQAGYVPYVNPAAQRRAEVSAQIMDVHDTSWAD